MSKPDRFPTDLALVTGPRRCARRYAARTTTAPSPGGPRLFARQFLTVHKSEACETAETRRYPWDDLDMFMWELFKNARFDWEKVEERRAEGREFGLNN